MANNKAPAAGAISSEATADQTGNPSGISSFAAMAPTAPQSAETADVLIPVEVQMASTMTMVDSKVSNWCGEKQARLPHMVMAR